MGQLSKLKSLKLKNVGLTSLDGLNLEKLSHFERLEVPCNSLKSVLQGLFELSKFQALYIPENPSFERKLLPHTWECVVPDFFAPKRCLVNNPRAAEAAAKAERRKEFIKAANTINCAHKSMLQGDRKATFDHLGISGGLIHGDQVFKKVINKLLKAVHPDKNLESDNVLATAVFKRLSDIKSHSQYFLTQ